MRIEAASSFIEFEFKYAELAHHPSIAFSIQVDSNGFKGYIEEVWFSLFDLEDFLIQLETLERQRQGRAKLVQLSDASEYCPFRFELVSIDKLGHLAIFAEMQKIEYLGNYSTLFSNKVSVTFEIDPGSLPTILKNFRVLIAPHSNDPP